MARKPKAGMDPDLAGTEVGKLITPEQLAKSGSEHAHQCAVMQWVALVGMKAFPELLWMLHAIPNGGDRSKSVGASMKAEGVKKGVPDLCLPVPQKIVRHEAPDIGILSGWFHGLYIEMKTPEAFAKKDNGCSPEQIEWHRRLLAQGHAVAVCAGWQSACWVLGLYLHGELVMPEAGPLLASAVDQPPGLLPPGA
jgi:hypothetical protein